VPNAHTTVASPTINLTRLILLGPRFRLERRSM